ncbi:PEP-CTERM sorting domain-containing protein [Massilia sp. IC2-476]|uniref:PEP-CTERM sorting domain-containing protein n=1 Tax=Massilia sp. IC2-476 TaxID=2887199 RepID=UPI001D113928|nr:PEP-CTERM sorting domain-containing protein [Massilia sp. IC2-476]MCC2974385.1 PEP-CTERM sorting domain-containing protein [Massilia sp. IC2-476]
MDRSYPYSRRLLSRARLHKRMAVMAAAGLLGATAMFMLTWKPDPIASAVQASSLLASTDGVQSVRGVRRVYPYSVVPGGVSGKTELARVIRTDRVVASHYATFDVDQARPVVVQKPRAVHVSYRKGGQVYWTAHKVMLAPGETLLSDGRSEMRARCANRISDVAQYPVEAHQPAMDELDNAVELDEDEEYALGPDGLPVSTAGGGGIPRHTGQRSPGRLGGGGGGGAAPGATAPDSMLASSTFSPASAMSTAMGMAGSSSSMGSRPRPAATPAPTTTPTGSGGSESSSGGSSGSQPTSGGGEPVSAPGAGTDVVTSPGIPETGAGQPPTGLPPVTGDPGTVPVPGTSPEPDPLPVFTPEPLPQPGNPVPTPPAGNGPLFPPTGPETGPLIPQPPLTPAPPLENVEQEPKAPNTVPEPGSAWLLAGALASMLGLRRRARFKRES